jgi:hypothetical protein
MKKIFAILAVLAFFMVPAASMAMVQTTDADLATITGAGVTIDISSLSIGMSMDSISWGDYNPLTFSASGVLYNQGGSINIIPLSGSMHVGVSGLSNFSAGNATNSGYDTFTTEDLIVNINVGTHGATTLTAATGQNYSAGGTTAIQLGFVNGIAINLDGFVADIVLDATNAAYTDWKMISIGAPVYNANAAFNNTNDDGSNGAGGKSAESLASKTLGTFGIAGVKMAILPFNVTISAH